MNPQIAAQHIKEQTERGEVAAAESWEQQDSEGDLVRWRFF